MKNVVKTEVVITKMKLGKFLVGDLQQKDIDLG